MLVPLLGAKESEFARFHANQGLALLAASVAYSVAMGIVDAALLSVSWRFYSALGIVRLAGLVFPALSIMGIMNAVGGQATAKKIGEDACARIIIGRRVLYSVSKVQKYLETIAE